MINSVVICYLNIKLLLPYSRMKDFELMMAHMEKVTSPELREACYKKGADSTFTEMAN